MQQSSFQEFVRGKNFVKGAMLYSTRGSEDQIVVDFNTKSQAVAVEYEGVHDVGDGSQYWKLYYDNGSGFNDNECVKFQIDGKQVRLRFVLQSVNGFYGFKLAPSNVKDVISIEKLQISNENNLVARTRKLFSVVDNAIKFRGGGVIGSFRLAKDVSRRGIQHYLTSAAQLSKSGVSVSSQTKNNQFLAHGDVGNYESWLRFGKPSLDDKKASLEVSDALPYRPKISVVMPTYNSEINALKKAIESLLNQYYDNWELIICDDGSTSTGHFSVVQEYVDNDSRMTFLKNTNNCGISAASNRCIGVATGEFIAFLDHDDVLALHALFACVLVLNQSSEIDWIYSDEDKIDENDRRYGPYFKPDWSPVFFMSCMYTCHFSLYRKSLGDKIGWFRSEYDQAQDYDFALRFSRETGRVHHISDVLYCWRALKTSTASGADAKPIAEKKARRAVQDHINHLGYPANVVEGPFAGSHRVVLRKQKSTKISIVVPTAGQKYETKYMVKTLITGIMAKSKGFEIEYLVSVNPDCPDDLLEWLANVGVTIVHHTPTNPFNLAHKINEAVAAAANDCVLLLNDDMAPKNADWLSEIYSYFQLDNVCAVGAKLLFPDNTIQHVGVTLLSQGPSHLYYGAAEDAIGLVGFAASPRESLAVTGACIMFHKADYMAVNGFSPEFRINYNDVDFCLKLREHTGKSIICNPNAVIYHYESISREAPPPNELNRFNEKWPEYVGRDPYYNPNLSQNSTCHEVTSNYQTYSERYLKY